jgi:hypothetical protein
VGGYDGGINLASGGLGRPVHGEVAASTAVRLPTRPLGAIRGEVVLCVHRDVVKLVSYLNLTLS